MSRNLVLLGMMGVGKTTVALRLGERLGREVVDTDAEVERIAGRSVTTIFAEEGEAAFRRLERTAVERLSRCADKVVSVGGGAVLDEANVAALRRSGVLVELRAPPETLAERLVRQSAGDHPVHARPLLAGDDLVDRITQLIGVRGPRYAAVADHWVDATAAPSDVADEILSWASSVPGVLAPAESGRGRR